MTTLPKENLARHRTITLDLHAQIAQGGLKPGDLLPSYRTLMDRYDVTVGTVRQALGSLQSQGLVHSVPGVGCVVSQPTQSCLRAGIVVVDNAPTEGFFRQLTLIQDELDQLHCDLGIRLMPAITPTSTQALVNWAKRHDGVLLYGKVTAALAASMEATGIPAVLLGEPIDGPCPQGIGNVTLDMEATSALAISLLTGLGHKNIGLCCRTGSRYFSLLQQSFHDTLSKHALPPGPVYHFKGIRETDYTGAVAWLKSLPTRPSALVVEEGSRATALLQALSHAGIRVPDDISVLVIVPSDSPEQGQGTLSRVLTPTQDLVLRGAALLAQSLRAPARYVRVEKIVGTYLPGHTIRFLSDT